jgi:hypothetical protein
MCIVALRTVIHSPCPRYLLLFLLLLLLLLLVLLLLVLLLLLLPPYLGQTIRQERAGEESERGEAGRGGTVCVQVDHSIVQYSMSAVWYSGVCSTIRVDKKAESERREAGMVEYSHTGTGMLVNWYCMCGTGMYSTGMLVYWYSLYSTGTLLVLYVQYWYFIGTVCAVLVLYWYGTAYFSARCHCTAFSTSHRTPLSRILCHIDITVPCVVQAKREAKEKARKEAEEEMLRQEEEEEQARKEAEEEVSSCVYEFMRLEPVLESVRLL